MEPRLLHRRPDSLPAEPLGSVPGATQTVRDPDLRALHTLRSALQWWRDVEGPTTGKQNVHPPSSHRLATPD